MGNDISEREYDQIYLVNSLQNTARAFYDDNYQPYTEKTKHLSRTGLSAGLAPHVEKRWVAPITEWLQASRIVQLAYHKRGSSAQILAAWTEHGKICAIRIPTSFAEREAHDRIDHPANVQPLKDEKSQPVIFSYRDNTNIEALPFGPVAYIERFDLLKGLHGIAGLDYAALTNREYLLMPNGAPLPVDPDMLKYGRMRIPSEHNTGIHDHIFRNNPLLKPLAWMQGEIPIQEIFFPPGYLSTPLAPKFVPFATEDRHGFD